MLTDPDGNSFDVRQDITDISTSLCTDQCPGTASFTISYPEHSGGRKGMSKYKNLMIMSEIVIYFRGRFLKEDPKDATKTKYPYYQAFWGVISAITTNYSDGVHTISVSCADILRWWQITNVTINPSILSSVDATFKKAYVEALGVKEEDEKSFLSGNTVVDNLGRQISIFSNIFSNLTTAEILQKCCSLSMLQMMPLRDNLIQQIKAVPIGPTTKGKITEKIGDSLSASQMKYWAERFNMVGRSLRIFGLQVDKDGQFKGRLNIDMSGVVTNNASVGTPTIVYQMFPASPPVVKSERKSQLDVANELKETLHFEFFMDVNGDIVFKPPFYNLDVKSNAPNSYIEDLDILNWNFIQSESEVVTRIDVTGSLSRVAGGGLAAPVGTAFNPYLQLQFGERPQERQMPWLLNTDQCFFWAKSELARQNALIRQGTVTIVGRPELRLGYPVFVPSRDAFYYIKGIENRFTFGGTFTTTLTLVAERAQTGVISGLFRNVGELKDEQEPELGSSNCEPNETNNFIKQTYSPTVCTPRAQQHLSIVQPNFTIDLSKKRSDTQGEWKTFSGATAEPDKKNFQISDSSGYEIIGQIGEEPYVSYGYGTQWNYDSKLQESIASQDKKVPLTMDISNSTLRVSPNNSMLTLDDENSKMIDFGKSDAISAAQKAQQLDVKKS
jgi:hypothetical protein